jgi:hypothetical protein
LPLGHIKVIIRLIQIEAINNEPGKRKKDRLAGIS